MRDLKTGLLFPAASILFGCLFALIIVEVILRIFSLAPTSILNSVDKREFDIIPGIWKPNQKLVAREVPALPYQIAINSLGYRGEEFTRQKPAGEFRILMTGDSFTFSVLVDDASTLPAQIERNLRDRCRAGSIRVVNAGLPGSTIDGQDEIVKRGLTLSPDLVVIVFHENDLTDLMAPLWDRMKANREAKSTGITGIVWPLFRNLALWNFSLKIYDKWRINRATQEALSATPQTNKLPEPDAWSPELRAKYRDRLVGLRDILASRGIGLVFAAMPGQSSVEGKRDAEIVHWAIQMAKEAGIPTASALEGLRKGLPVPGQGYLLPIDGHASALGNKVAGAAIAQQMFELQPLRKPCG